MAKEKKTVSPIRKVIAGIAIAILVIMLFANLGKSGTSKSASSSDGSQSAVSAQEGSDTTSGDEQETADSQPENDATQELGINDILTTSEFEFSISYIIEASQITNEIGMTYESDPGNVFLLALINATNITDETINVASPQFNSYVDGKKIVPESVVGAIDGAMPLVGAVSPGQSFLGHAVWEVPEDWETFQFSYIGNWGGDSDPFIIHASDVR